MYMSYDYHVAKQGTKPKRRADKENAFGEQAGQTIEGISPL